LLCFLLYPFRLYRTLTVSRIFIFLWIYTQSIILLGRVIGPSQGLYLNTGQHKEYKRALAHTHTRAHKTSMPSVGFEPRLTASERAKTGHASNHSSTVTGPVIFIKHIFSFTIFSKIYPNYCISQNIR
jgi:hypothetical protein